MKNMFLKLVRAAAPAVVGCVFSFATTLTSAACPFVGTNWDFLNEGLIFTRYALNVSGPPLTANTRSASLDPQQVSNSLNALRPMLDMNADNQINAVDATIVARYLAGFRDASLTNGLSLAGGTRDTAQAVLDFIATGCLAGASSPTRTPLYESLAAVSGRVALLAQLNSQGARGFEYVGPFTLSDAFDLYAKDRSTTFTYEALDTPSTVATLAAQLNAQGVRGFRLAKTLTTGSYYVKDNTTNLTYQYEILAEAPTSSGFLTQATQQGARGYFFAFAYVVGGAIVAIYAKDSSSAVYAYELLPSSFEGVSANAFVAQADAQGARGFKFFTGFAFSGNTEGDQFRNIYVKDTTQNATYSFKAQTSSATSSALVSQANAEGQINFVFSSGLIFFPDGIFNPSDTRNIYYKPLNCAGWRLCSAGGGPL
jgi:hypothetical protein